MPTSTYEHGNRTWKPGAGPGGRRRGRRGQPRAGRQRRDGRHHHAGRRARHRTGGHRAGRRSSTRRAGRDYLGADGDRGYRLGRHGSPISPAAHRGDVRRRPGLRQRGPRQGWPADHTWPAARTRTGDVLAPVFSVLGRATAWLGQAGNGTRAKLVLNNWLADLTETTAETLAFARRRGLDPAEIVDLLAANPLGAPYAVQKAHVMLSGDFSPAFALKHALKDAELAAQAAQVDGRRPAHPDQRAAPALARYRGERSRRRRPGLGLPDRLTGARRDQAAARKPRPARCRGRGTGARWRRTTPPGAVTARPRAAPQPGLTSRAPWRR